MDTERKKEMSAVPAAVIVSALEKQLTTQRPSELLSLNVTRCRLTSWIAARRGMHRVGPRRSAAFPGIVRNKYLPESGQGWKGKNEMFFSCL